MARPARGTECVLCREHGHRCEAVIFSAPAPDCADVPLCMACANDEPCIFARCAGQGRDGSSTRVERDVWGDVVEVGHVSEVAHRTAEELGLARTVPDIPPPAPPRRATSVDWEPKHDRSTVSARKLHRDAPKTMSVTARPARPTPAREPEDVPERMVRRVRVKMPAAACMGAEMLEGFAREDAQKGGAMVNPRVNGVGPEKRRQALELYEEGKLTTGEICKTVGIAVSTLYRITKNVQRRIRVKDRSEEGAAAPAAMIPVVIDAKRPGTMSALLGALAKQDAARTAGEGEDVVTLQLTHAQLAAIVAGLTPQQQTQMIVAGLPAALAAARG